MVLMVFHLPRVVMCALSEDVAGPPVLYMKQRGLTGMDRRYRIFLANANCFSVLALRAEIMKSSAAMCESLLGDSV